MIPDYKRVQQATYFNPLINMIPENRFVPCLPYYNMVFKLTDNGMSFLLLKELSFVSYLVPTYFLIITAQSTMSSCLASHCFKTLILCKPPRQLPYLFKYLIAALHESAKENDCKYNFMVKDP